jgi:predicted ATPase
LEATAEGTPCAVIVHGEAGVGKTRLVRAVLDSASAELDAGVHWGTCVQFGASTVPFAPMLRALRNVLPPATDSSASARMLPIIDATVNELAARGLTVLVVDDLQWADVSSLDVLAYLVAGFTHQRLAVVATCRDENRPEGHPLHGWLADMRRMPGFFEIALGRFDLDQTAELLAELHGGGPDLELAALVRARSDGNPYLTELLAREIEPGAHEIPRSTPDRLRDALTATWHRLDPVSRELSRILAVGGRPVDRPVLTEVAVAHGIDAAMVGPALAACTAQGIVEADQDGRWWFRHPLLAAVLYDQIPPEAVVRSHAVFADALARRSDSAPSDLAVHQERAGNLDAAFGWSLAAASAASAVRASAEEAQHLMRACRLWPRVADDRRGSDVDRVDLAVPGGTCEPAEQPLRRRAAAPRGGPEPGRRARGAAHEQPAAQRVVRGDVGGLGTQHLAGGGAVRRRAPERGVPGQPGTGDGAGQARRGGVLGPEGRLRASALGRGLEGGETERLRPGSRPGPEHLGVRASGGDRTGDGRGPGSTPARAPVW